MTGSAAAPLGTVAHYNLLERLEPAGPGELFRARDTRLGRTVAVRSLPVGYLRTPEEHEAFLAHARSMRALSHPNITALFDAGEVDGRLYLAFEFLKGQSLRMEMGGRPLHVRRAVELAIQIAEGVSDAHAAGLIHGGLSPDTVIITAKGHAKIPAFELASRTGFEDGPAGVRLRDYDSPEEARGQAADERSDIHSVGAVLYEMLTARRPSHKGASAPSTGNPHVPAELDELVLRAIAPNPDARLQSVVTLAAELRSIAAILEVRGGAGDDGGDEPSAASGLQLGRAVLIAIGVLALAGAAFWVLTAR